MHQVCVFIKTHKSVYYLSQNMRFYQNTLIFSVWLCKSKGFHNFVYESVCSQRTTIEKQIRHPLEGGLFRFDSVLCQTI